MPRYVIARYREPRISVAVKEGTTGRRAVRAHALFLGRTCQIDTGMEVGVTWTMLCPRPLPLPALTLTMMVALIFLLWKISLIAYFGLFLLWFLASSPLVGRSLLGMRGSAVLLPRGANGIWIGAVKSAGLVIAWNQAVHPHLLSYTFRAHMVFQPSEIGGVGFTLCPVSYQGS